MPQLRHRRLLHQPVHVHLIVVLLQLHLLDPLLHHLQVLSVP